jgi:hypothetical protein
MSANVRQLKRRPAKRPAARTVSVTIEDGDFAGWSATARADFPAGLVLDLNSGDIERILAVLETIIVEHNMPNDRDELAERLADVDPYAGLLAVANAIGDALIALPPR